MVVIDKLFGGRPSTSSSALPLSLSSSSSLRGLLGRVGVFVLNVYIILLALSPSSDEGGRSGGLIITVKGQFQKGSPLYKQAIKKGKMDLYEEISTNPDVNLYFHPENAFIDNNGYKYDYPNPEQYRISMLIDPCRFQEDPG